MSDNPVRNYVFDHLGHVADELQRMLRTFDRWRELNAATPPTGAIVKYEHSKRVREAFADWQRTCTEVCRE